MADQKYTFLIIGAPGNPGEVATVGEDGVNSVAKNTGQPGSKGTSCGWGGSDVCAENGTAGAPAVSEGGPGGNAKGGGTAPMFTLKSDQYTVTNGASISILSIGGTGGTGADGGTGGAGADGGKAGENHSNCLKKGKCQPTRGGKGGKGLDGGIGGDAGAGGDGGIVNIYYKTSGERQLIVPLSNGGPAGNPGEGGVGGAGGQGGQNETWPEGSGVTHAGTGNPGIQPSGGAPNNPGNPGSVNWIKFS